VGRTGSHAAWQSQAVWWGRGPTARSMVSAGDTAPPHHLSPQLPNRTGGCISGQGSRRSCSSRYSAKTGMAALTKKSALPSSPWMCPGGPWREGDHQHPRLHISAILQEGWVLHPGGRGVGRCVPEPQPLG